MSLKAKAACVYRHLMRLWNVTIMEYFAKVYIRKVFIMKHIGTTLKLGKLGGNLIQTKRSEVLPLYVIKVNLLKA